MKTGNAALLIAAGIVLLWVVTSGRSKNLASAWATLLMLPQPGSQLTAGQGSSAGNVWGSIASGIPGIGTPDSNTGIVIPPMVFPPGDTLPSGDFLNNASYSMNNTPSLVSHFNVPGSGYSYA